MSYFVYKIFAIKSRNRRKKRPHWPHFKRDDSHFSIAYRWFARFRPSYCPLPGNVWLSCSIYSFKPFVNQSSRRFEPMYRRPIAVSKSNYRRASSYARMPLAVVILSVRPFVRLSNRQTRALRQNETMHCGYFYTTRKAITLVFWHQQWLVGDAPFVQNLHSKWPTPFEKHQLRQISAYNVSTVGDSEKKFSYGE